MSDRPNSQASDITELKKVQQKPLNGELAVDIIEAIPDSVVMVGMDGKVTFINKAFEKILGYNGNEIVGISAVGLPTYRNSKDEKRARQALKMVIEKGSAEPVDMIALTKDGREIPISLSASAIKDARGNPKSLVVVIRDITERKKAEVLSYRAPR